jgi:hypothetical protein
VLVQLCSSVDGGLLDGLEEKFCSLAVISVDLISYSPATPGCSTSTR